MLNIKKLFTKILSSLSSISSNMLSKNNVKGGLAAVGQIAANSYKDVEITHNLGVIPIISATLFSTGTASNIGSVCVAIAARTSTTATIRVFNDRNSIVTPSVTWIAIKNS